MSYVDDLSHEYERLHVAKEAAFWTALMGLNEDADAAQADLDREEIALKRFLRDPERLARTRAELERARAARAEADETTALEGWVRTLEAYVIDRPEALALAEEIVDAEGKLARTRAKMKLGYTVDGEFTEASSVKLGVMVNTDPDEKRRRAAWEALESIEELVLSSGFLEIVRQRNQLGRMLGGEDYYDWKVRVAEGMSKAEVFALLSDLEERTRESGRRALDGLVEEHGAMAREPWNVRYLGTGDVTTEQDPYFPFSRSFERWGRSFAALAIDYNGAEMVLDLVDRKGKFENGFMHGPVPAWRDRGSYRPARIHFTANAIPGMVGAGRRAAETLFHEGGHAAHFANIDMPAPCFSQEFAPTSVAFAEVQSMFLDSLLSDADWQERYASTAAGEPMPFELIERGIRASQRLDAYALRSMTAVCFAERAIYEIPDDELTAERVVEEIRAAEKRFLFLERGSPRPALSIPHLISGDASAYYHGYVLALMGVEQTRTFFLERDGHLMDNPRIGPDLKRAYWQPGNSVRFLDCIERLTGTPLTAAALAARGNRTPEEAVAEARARVERAKTIPRHEGEIRLGAKIRVMHGQETIAAVTNGDFAAAASDFATWIDSQTG